MYIFYLYIYIHNMYIIYDDILSVTHTEHELI